MICIIFCVFPTDPCLSTLYQSLRLIINRLLMISRLVMGLIPTIVSEVGELEVVGMDLVTRKESMIGS